VVSVTEPYGSIFGFLDRSRYFFFQISLPSIFIDNQNAIEAALKYQITKENVATSKSSIMFCGRSFNFYLRVEKLAYACPRLSYKFSVKIEAGKLGRKYIPSNLKH
jgi:hypothetical protein